MSQVGFGPCLGRGGGMVLLVALWLPGHALAQSFGGVFPGGQGGASAATPDPARADTAASYTATGPDGVKTTPQPAPAALGTCAALAGAYASAIPAGETGARPFFCDGVTWLRMKRVVEVRSTLSIPVLQPAQESTLTAAVAGAVAGEGVQVTMNCEEAFITVRRARVSSADTVSIVIANTDTQNVNPDVPTDCSFTVEVSK